MKKLVFLTILFLSILIPNVTQACELSYQEYKDKGIVQSFVVGEYVFNVDNGYSPSLEDFATAARSIKKGEDVKVYNIFSIGNIYYKVTEIFSNKSTNNVNEFPNIDVTYEYRNHIRNAKESDYTIYTCKKKNIKINFNGLYTEGNFEYKTKAIRYAAIDSSSDIKEIKYCTTIKEECNPDIIVENSNLKEIKVEYDTNVSAQRVCIEAKNTQGEESGIVCDSENVKVDKEYIKIKNINEKTEIIEGKPENLSGLFEVTYSVSGGNLQYYNYNQDEKKEPINDLSQLTEGTNTIELVAKSGNGLISSETTLINVKKSVVTYDANGGTKVDKELDSIIYGGKADLSVKAEKEGYKFIGWNTDPSSHTILDSLIVKDNVTLYAIYEKTINAEFIVTRNGLKTPAVSEYEIASCKLYGSETTCSIKVPTISAKMGYKVDGWSFEEGSERALYKGGEIIEIKNDIKMYSVSYEKKAITATFITYDGNKAKENILKCYKYNGKDTCSIDTTILDNKKYNSLDFTGYTDNYNNINNQTSFEISEGKTYYAFYEKTSKVTFISWNKTTEDKIKTWYIMTLDGIKEIYEEKDVIPLENVDGYDVDGYREDTKSEESTLKSQKYKTNKDIVYYGIYKKEIKIAYKGNEDEQNILKSDIKNGYINASTKEIQNVEFTLDDGNKIVKENHIFNGWSDGEKEYAPGSKIMLKESKELIAIWVENGCKVIFDYGTNGGVSADQSSAIYYYDEQKPIDVTKIKAYKPGWEFIGWSKYEDSNENPLSQFAPENDEKQVKLYAMFKKTITVTFEINDTSAYSLSSEKQVKYTMYNKDTKIELTLPYVININNKYSFIGWSSNKDAETKEYNEGEKIALGENTNIYGIVRNDQEIKVTYNYYENGERKQIIKYCNRYNAHQTCETSSGIENIVEDGGTLIGWSESSETVSIKEKQENSENRNYYAVYDKLISIYYNSGINKSVTSSEIYKINLLTTQNGIKKIGIDVELDIPDAIEGYLSIGWRIDSNLEDCTYKKGQVINLTDNMILNGIYKKTIDLSFNCNDANESIESVSKDVYYNSVIEDKNIKATFMLDKSLTRVGYDFVSWVLENKEYTVGEEISISESKELTPKWQAKIYKITYDYETNGGTGISTHPTEIYYNEKVDVTPIATKDGYEFVGWNLDFEAHEAESVINVPNEDFKVYAIFRKKIEANWILIDEKAGKLEKSKTECYKYNNDSTCKIETGVIVPTTGYIVDGWTTIQGSIDVDAPNNFFYDIDESKNFYSVTRLKKQLVATFYYGVDDQISTINNSCALYNGNSKCSIKNPLNPYLYKKTQFKAWSEDKYKYVESNMEIANDKTYYAHYLRTVSLNYLTGATNSIETRTNTVEYILSDVGDHEIIPKYTIEEPESIDTYESLGWRSDDERTESEEKYLSGKSIDLINSLDLNSVYKRNITISYDSHGGSYTPESKTETQYYNSVSGATNHLQVLPDDVKITGWTLKGWAEDTEDGNLFAPAYNYYLYKPIIMHAIWERNYYSVTFVGNYITASENPTKVGYGLTKTLTLTPDTRYYIESISCDNGYTISGVSTGTNAYNLQTAVISNNNNTTDATCTIKMHARSYAARAENYQCNCTKTCRSYCCETASTGCSNCCTKYCIDYSKCTETCSTCTRYSCPNGGTLSGTTCVF